MQQDTKPELKSLFNIEETTKDYLSSRKFSTGIKFDWSSIPLFMGSRYDILPNLLKNKRVLHFGFADHLDQIDEKIKQGRWLHGRLLNSCKYIAGIDISEEAVNLCKTKGIKDIYALDIMQDLPSELSKEFDYILCADVIEHLPEAVKIFSRLRDLCDKLGCKCLVTSPNAWSLHFLLPVLEGKETVNTDHLCIYSPYTLLRLLALAGFQDFSIGISSLGIEKGKKLNIFFNLINILSMNKYNFNVLLGHDLIIEATP
jgi:hypothetical protein